MNNTDDALEVGGTAAPTELESAVVSLPCIRGDAIIQPGTKEGHHRMNEREKGGEDNSTRRWQSKAL